MRARPATRCGFTLVELLVVIAIIAVLSSITFASVTWIVHRAHETKELSNARQLMIGYLRYAGENDGKLLPGFGNFPAQDDRGNDVANPVNQRYPWRLAPSVSYEMHLFWGVGDDDNIRKLEALSHFDYVYGISVQPALGVNALFVGGDYESLPPDNPKATGKFGSFCVTRLSQATRPASLVVFASASSVYQGGKLTGYFKVEAPYKAARGWVNTYHASDPPTAHGYVDFRYHDRAVVAMLDGHCELLSFDELNDMRYWANPASEANDRTWYLGKN